MSKILAGVLAAATIAACAGAAKAESTCAWLRTGIWECNDNGVVTHYYSLPAGPNTLIRSVPTPQPTYPAPAIPGPQ